MSKHNQDGPGMDHTERSLPLLKLWIVKLLYLRT